MKKDFIEACSKELKIIRIENNDRIDDLAEKSEVAASTICRYENGEKDISIMKLEQILKPYNVSLYIFFNRVLAKTQNNS